MSDLLKLLAVGVSQVFELDHDMFGFEVLDIERFRNPLSGGCSPLSDLIVLQFTIPQA